MPKPPAEDFRQRQAFRGVELAASGTNSGNAAFRGGGFRQLGMGEN
ncbi:hypothetical protein [Baaleninema sp.]